MIIASLKPEACFPRLPCSQAQACDLVSANSMHQSETLGYKWRPNEDWSWWVELVIQLLEAAATPVALEFRVDGPTYMLVPWMK